MKSKNVKIGKVYQVKYFGDNVKVLKKKKNGLLKVVFIDSKRKEKMIVPARYIK